MSINETEPKPEITYSQKHNLNLAEFAYRQRQVICIRELWKAAISGCTLSLSICYAGIMVYTKYKGLVRAQTKALLLTMSGTFAFWLWGEIAQSRCVKRFAEERTKGLIKRDEYSLI